MTMPDGHIPAAGADWAVVLDGQCHPVVLEAGRVTVIGRGGGVRDRYYERTGISLF